MRVAINAIIIQDNSVLLVRKKDTWILPGGKPQQTESDISCLLREVSEELSGTILKNIEYYQDFEGYTPHKGDMLRAKTYFANIHGNLNPVSAEIQEKEFIINQDMERYNLSDISSKIIKQLRIDKYLK